ncbi:MAG: hypothetical protein M3Y27_20965, partial [Acidobacteriota bacterium]|nr:hypothetical protein [Acidobacteriota bacterium]
VRETSWYALGLLQRDRPGDRARAIRALDAVLGQQFHEPGERWDGTFYRAPEEAHPPPTAQMWTDYDPNWREFIGTTFALILLDHRTQLPPELTLRLGKSIQQSIAGEIQENRLKASYTNISLMYGFLWNYAAKQFNRPEWIRPSENWTRAVYQGFKEHNAFNEFNSPTYYGVDLYGLSLWRVHGGTPAIRQMGADMEAALWRSIAQFYHAGLKNMAGPYDRSYGMDMRRYVSLLGLWLRTVLPANTAPFPELREPLEHADDLMFAPCAVSVATKIPEDAMAHFRKFQGERLVEQRITGERVATAWIGKDVLLGAESTGFTKESGSPRSQFHPVTIHWTVPSGAQKEDVGWIRLIQSPRINARAERDKITITAIGDARFRISAPGLQPSRIVRDHWVLPGLTVDVDTDARSAEVVPGDGYVDVVYHQATRYKLITASSS